MITVSEPRINFIKRKDRKDGISAFMRIRNGEDYLRESILSVVDQVDEIICVFNNSVDRTEEILIELEALYPGKIKVYKYLPIVYPPNSKKYLQTPENSVNSLAYYYNYAMSLTTYSHLFKFDDDELFFSGVLTKYKKELEDKPNVAIPMYGINLFDLKGELYLNNNELRTSGWDTLFFKYDNSCFFVKTNDYEVFTSNHRFVERRDSFYHTKRCKSDRGINNYDLTEEGGENSRYYDENLKLFKNLALEEFYSSDIYLKNKVCPKSLGFTFKGEKKYNLKILNKLENKIRV